MIRIIGAFAVAMLVAGCGTTPVAMNYVASGNLSQFSSSSGAVTAGAFADSRGEGPKWLGAIRGGYGNPLKVLEADTSVSTLVQGAFAEGLKARGASTTAAKKYEVRGDIRKLDCSQYVRREAHGVIEITVMDSRTGAERFRRSYSADKVDDSNAMSSGAFGSVEDLRRVAEQVLRQIVDKVLDDPAFRDAVRG
jgi:uncharacterized lipoprotein YajG